MGKLISSKLITEGMILELPVINKFGQTLLPSGIEITSNTIELLTTWGIKAVSILVDNETTEFNDNHKIKATELLHRTLKWKPRNELEYELYNLAFHTVLKTLTNSQQDDKYAIRS